MRTIINARKFDQSIHRSWQCEIVEQTDSLLVFVGEFEEEVRHEKLGVIQRGTVSYEFYWLDRWYNVFRFHEPDGSLRNFYCNLNLPPVFTNGVLDYVDLDIDIVIWKNFGYEILDLEEFQENALRFSYPEDLKSNVQKNLDELLQKIETREFPFDFK